MDDALNNHHIQNPIHFPTNFVEGHTIICYRPDITVKELPTWSIKNDQGGGMPRPLFLTPVGASMFPLRGDIWDKEFTTFSI